MCVRGCVFLHELFNACETKYSHLRKPPFAPRLARGERDNGLASIHNFVSHHNSNATNMNVCYSAQSQIILRNSQLLPSSVNRLVSFTERKNVYDTS